MQLNETSAFLWTQFDNTTDINSLTEQCIHHFHCSQTDYSAIQSSVVQFINSLCEKGILIPDTVMLTNSKPSKTLRIANLFCRFYNLNIEFPKEFLAFETHEVIFADSPCMNINILPKVPIHHKNGNLILRNESLCILDTDDKYLLLFPSFHEVKEASITKNGTEATLYSASDFTPRGIEEFSYAVRILFFYFAQMHNMTAIHSASILYADRLWLFSGSSGTGKSTHTNLWQENFSTPVINGDLNLITLSNGLPTVHGIPWCGTSGIYHTQSYPLGGIIFLEQGNTNMVSEYTADRKQLALLHRCVSPSWTATLQEFNCNILQEISDNIYICKLSCTADNTAVACIKNAIDKYLDNL